MTSWTNDKLDNSFGVGDYVLLPTRASRNEVGLRWGKVIRVYEDFDRDAIQVITEDERVVLLSSKDVIHIPEEDVFLSVMKKF